MLACFAVSSRAQVNIKVDVAQKGIEISPTLYGIFYEDINFASDGGLYAELIRNRSFEFNAEKPEHWKAERSEISLVSDDLLNEKQGHALLVKSPIPAAGISNEGFWGINVVAGTQYKLSFWIKVLHGKPGSLLARLATKTASSPQPTKAARTAVASIWLRSSRPFILPSCASQAAATWKATLSPRTPTIGREPSAR